MQIIPVVDLLNGQVVHAVAGNRSQYQVFESSRFDFDSPFELVSALVSEFEPSWLYVADLNAIQGSGDNLDSIQQFAGLATCFLIDFGFRAWPSYLELNETLSPELNWMPVFGSESLDSFSNLAKEAQQDIQSCFVSLDIKGSHVLTPTEGGPKQKAPELLAELDHLGFRNVIVLDLDSVGKGKVGREGMCQPFLNRIGLDWPIPETMQLFAGGGIHNEKELGELSERGYTGALIATAIHNGDIRRNQNDLRQF